MTVIDRAVELALSIANDPKHGYDQTNRWGPDYDCSSLLIHVWESVGVRVKTNGASYTGNMLNVFLKCGFVDVTKEVNLNTGEGVQKGDILLNTRNHVEMAIGGGQIVGASINELGQITGGQSGDQTGKEIRVTSYYNYPWHYVLRYGGATSYEWVVYDTDQAGKMTEADQENNVMIIFSILSSQYGWTREAIAGALGSMQLESYFNPGQWELGHKSDSVDGYGFGYGYGLIQWTRPSSEYPNPYLNYCYNNNIDRLSGNEQLKYLNTGITNSNLWGWIATSSYPESFNDYINSTESPEYLASVWFHNLERPPASDTTEPTRKQKARYWYDWLEGKVPIVPGSGVIRKKQGLSLLMMYLATKKVI